MLKAQPPATIDLIDNTADFLSLSTILEDVTISTGSSKLFLYMDSAEVVKLFKENIFAPWDTKQSIKLAYLAVQDLVQYYTYNYRPITREIVSYDIMNSNMDNFCHLMSKAIVTRNTILKRLPTNKPYFYYHNKAEEGHLSDYMLHDVLYINAPLIILNQSKDGLWAMVKTINDIMGWIDIRDVAYISEEQEQFIRSTNLAVVIQENLPITLRGGIPLELAHIGTIVYNHGNQLYAAARNLNGMASLVKIHADIKGLIRHPRPIDGENVVALVPQLNSNVYNWEEGHHIRDCAKLIRDIFLTFFAILPGHASSDLETYIDTNAKIITLEGLGNKQKMDTIISNAVSFRSLILSPGHVALYIGYKDDDIIALQDTWGMKNQRQDQGGRVIVDKILISPTNLGKNIKHSHPFSLGVINKIMVF